MLSWAIGTGGWRDIGVLVVSDSPGEVPGLVSLRDHAAAHKDEA